MLRERLISEHWHTIDEFGVVWLPKSEGFNRSFGLAGDMWEAYGERRVPALSKGRSRGI